MSQRIEGSHPSVDHAIRTAHHGRAPALFDLKMNSDKPAGMDGYGPVKSGQKGYPGTD